MLAQFIPHGHCYLWKSNLVGLHLISDLLIAIAYYSIPVTLIYFVRKKEDLQYASILLLFAAFIVSCGTTHILEVWTLWHPTYWLSGAIKAITALISVYTAIEMYTIVPLALELPSPEQLQLANQKLIGEIEERKQTEQALRESESILRIFYDSAPMIMCIVELIDRQDLLYISGNNAAAKFFGLTTKTIQGKRSSELIFSQRNQHKLVDACLQSETFNQSVSLEFSDNINENQKYFSLTVSKIEQECPQKDSRFSYIMNDISDRKRVEIVWQESEERFRLAFEDAPIGMALVSPEGLFVKVNRSLCQMIGYREPELLSLTFQEITHPEDLDTDLTFLHELLEGKIRHYQMEKRYFHKLGHEVWILLIVSLVRDLQEKPQYFIAHIQDISERKAIETEITKSLEEQLEEKEVLLKEIHHRVKNNLQVICSLLNLQSRYLKEEKFIKSFKETQNRVRSMALVHEQLYQSKNISQIILSDYIKQLIGNLFRAYSITSSISYQIKADDFNLDLDTAVPCGLIINEIISNALKYAFLPKTKGEVTIEAFADRDKNLVLVIADNGKGLEPDFKIEDCKSLGLKLVKNLTQQLQGDLKIQSNENRGTQFEFTFTRIKK